MAAGMKVYDLLIACPNVGPAIASKVLRRVGMSPCLTLGKLTSRQRNELAGVPAAQGPTSSCGVAWTAATRSGRRGDDARCRGAAHARAGRDARRAAPHGGAAGASTGVGAAT
jgi:hypothetical protein